MSKIAMVTQKGGAGKSTLAICLALAALAAREEGETVALIDLDPNGAGGLGPRTRFDHEPAGNAGNLPRHR